MAEKLATIVGANGGFGRLFAGKLVDEGWTVGGVDLARPVEGSGPWSGFAAVPDANSSEEADEMLRRSSLVLLCVPTKPALWWLDRAAGLLSPDSLCLDILSVKTEVNARAEAAGFAGEYLSLHPMFAPRGAFRNHAVAAISVRGGHRTDEFLAMIKSWGAKVVPLSAEDHDRATAVLQVGVYAALLAVGRAAARSGVPMEALKALATPVAGPTFESIQRISTGDPAIYWAIQTENPYAQLSRNQLAEALGDLDRIARLGDEMGFVELVGEIKEKGD